MTHPAAPMILLVQAIETNKRPEMLRLAGFRVHGSCDITELGRDVLAIKPAMIAIELPASQSLDVFQCASDIRMQAHARDIPIIVYADRLRPDDIENAARARLLWVQIGAGDDLKLVAAIRGVLAGRAPADTR